MVISSSSSNFLGFFLISKKGFQARCSSEVQGRGIRRVFYNVYFIGTESGWPKERAYHNIISSSKV